MQNMPAYTPSLDNTLAIQVEELKIKVSELQKQYEFVKNLKIDNLEN
jgi:LEA14-like dessication related protein